MKYNEVNFEHILTRPWTFAKASTVNRITCYRIIEITIALLRTIETERAECTFVFAFIANPSSTASANAGLWITRSAIQTVTLFFTIFAISSIVTWSVTVMT